MLRPMHRFMIMLAASLLLASLPRAQTPLGTGFSYQGRLLINGAPASGNHDFQFRVFPVAGGGNALPGTPLLTRGSVPVVNGLFTVNLDFGPIFTGNKIWLAVLVRRTGTPTYVALSPRQELAPTPNATFAATALTANQVPWSGVTNRPPQRRQIVIPGSGLSYDASAQISPARWGLLLGSAAPPVRCVVPRPADWDPATSFSVTLLFAVPSINSAATVRWRLVAGSTNLNLPQANADSGWDSLDFSQMREHPGTDVYAAAGRTNLMKSQTWVATYSAPFGTWFMGNSVTTNNDFSHDPIWHFSFQRGTESYSGGLVVTSVVIEYGAKP